MVGIAVLDFESSKKQEMRLKCPTKVAQKESFFLWEGERHGGEAAARHLFCTLDLF